ncbi:hypothetical protein ACIRPS_02000 [Streptomyces griseoviridis]
MICDHCDQPILPEEGTTTIPVDSLSVAVPDVVVHTYPCVRTTPTPLYR